jgi:hypothetical protein
MDTPSGQRGDQDGVRGVHLLLKKEKKKKKNSRFYLWRRKY